MSAISSILSSALSAITVRQSTAASSVANVDSKDFKASKVTSPENQGGAKGQDRVAISQEALDMVANLTDFTATIAAVKSADQTEKKVFSIMA